MPAVSISPFIIIEGAVALIALTALILAIIALVAAKKRPDSSMNAPQNYYPRESTMPTEANFENTGQQNYRMFYIVKGRRQTDHSGNTNVAFLCR